MSLILKGFGKVLKNKEILAPINLTIKVNEIVAIQADMEHMNAFLSLVEGKRSYITNEIMMNEQSLQGCEDLFIYRPDMGEYKRLTPEQCIQFWCDLYKVKINIDNVLALTELTHIRNKKNKHLTFSEKKRLQFARSLVQNTSIFIFQEPTYQLDLQSKQVFNRVLNEILKNGGIVIVFTSSLEEGVRMATKVFRLNSRGLQEVELGDEGEKEAEVKEDETDSLIENDTVYQRKFEKISAKSDDKYILFDPLEIDFVETRERQTILHVNNEEFYSTVSMKEIESKLIPYGFYRCHRSYLVNLQRVREVVVWSKNSYSLTLDKGNEQTVPLSKSRYGELKAFLNW
ncbi:LytTR family transcriptional regulator DNA-binding domain-containing protein [Cytobacillus purgationiresistens]|uniref:ABC-2 type transport system ATP-binding protein n=1 Tax=Cytobacillus purgationiresistens TaxID=863449 RepID=A0ABU0AR05_9BACI|nr:LytTR family transcriptional regulator DNA-binding domain-containing protein [Cytobacillus purgationiresistens]MDQ0273677.1 ABC-2 type transport system ATP-binding protein [Cytobacillus purgationiresistens]